jgi:hypothetical protein
MSKKQKLREIWEADPEFPRQKTADKLGLDISTLYRYVRKFKAESKPKITSQDSKINNKIDTPKANLRTVSVSSLIDNERLDIKKIIRDGIRHIPAGEVSYDEYFRRDLQIPEPRWKEYSREEEFDNFRATLPNRKVVWGKKATINDIKQMDGVT